MEALSQVTKITILIGNGAVQANACESIQKFAEKYHIPMVTTLRAKGAVTEEHPLSLGVLGIGGSLRATHAVLGDTSLENGIVEQPEILLILGAGLNEQNAIALGDFSQNRKNYSC